MHSVFASATSSGIFAYSKFGDNFETVLAGAASESSLKSPKSLTFISATTLLISSFGSDEVLEFKYTGEFLRVFAEVAEPRGLLHLPDLDPPRVAVCSSGDGEVKFIAMDETFPIIRTGDYSNELTCLDELCYASCVYAMEGAAILFPRDFLGPFVDACAPLIDAAGDATNAVPRASRMVGDSPRPGLFAPLSETSLVTANITTTSPIVFTATSFHDRFGEPVVGIVDFTTFTIKATGPTDPSSCVLVSTLQMASIEAGEKFNVTIETYDIHNNPTEHAEDRFLFTFKGGQGMNVVRGVDGIAAFSKPVNVAGLHELTIVHVPTNIEVAGSPISFDVLPAPPNAAKSTHNIDFDEFESRKSADLELELRVDPFDRFDNPLPTATGYNVTINGGDPQPLLPPSFSYTHIVPRDFSGSLLLSFTLDGEHIANSPVTVEIAPDWTLTYIGSVLGAALLVGTMAFLRAQAIAKKTLRAVESDWVRSNSILKVEKDLLAQEIKMKKHTEEELKVMVAALESVSQKRQDELKEVIIDSEALKVGRLLGKGSFGVVHLASYQGVQVAMKQLITVNDENVLRFRHECFLMKNLSHPNVVKLVGVAWSENLMACCLEFAESGSLEHWLRLTAGGKKWAKEDVVDRSKEDEKRALIKASLEAKVFFGWNSENVDHSYPDQSKKKNKVIRMDISTSAMLVTAKEGSSDEAPVSVCYRLSITNPKFTGVTAVLNKVAANTIAKINIAPLISTKEKVEKILAEYTRPELSLAEVTFKGFDHHGDFNPAEHTDLDRAKKAEAEGLVEAWWRGGMNPKMGWTELLKKDKSRLDHGMSGYYKYDAETRFGEAMAHCYVDATPKQAPLEALKLSVERLLKEYKPPEHVVESLELTWKGGLWRMALEAALGVQYLHHHRYWSDGGKRVNGVMNEVEEEEAGWKESVIHRDLKPDNMLLTRDWTLKLTNFGEARAQNMDATMTSVGTPIYIAPEVMRGDRYDGRAADAWSFGLCLVAMIRAERTLEQFFYQALRKQKKLRNIRGLGMGQLTK
ncbi:hypothetical protein TeGR_g1842 [Tetraparma gracilis]|uniref:Protein kinase domain-containing protein n=1 Tax=Tetraparma gracilis TaxID=2962635 RepID=A0ABQ6MN17_9STRA|nr:hypothetical protein TeGR_g1842 [Tetraparma gracilis]